MDPNSAQLWIIGKFISSTSRVGCAANDVATSRAIARTSLTAYPADAESAIADECTIVTGLECCDGRGGASHYPHNRGRRTRCAQAGGIPRSELQKERGRNRQSFDRNMAGRTSLHRQAIAGA